MEPKSSTEPIQNEQDASTLPFQIRNAKSMDRGTASHNCYPLDDELNQISSKEHIMDHQISQ